ncbi:MAG: pseudouridine synthase [Chloroflexota bacterium]|nr:pseudouridine synthase [Chloroflexota bacterium]NOG63185.1 pseudouridine synthase [Chloroflexota bacterium]GIK62997.1 MAG: pseudouridine synthase [Chloroflexota bacterium]
MAHPKYRILRFYKPYGVLTKFTDAEGRPTLADYVDVPNVYPAGRLDMDSEGLLILTDFGLLSQRLTDPAYRHPRTYLAQVERIPDEVALEKLRAGVVIEGNKTLPTLVELLDHEPDLPPRDPPVRFRKSVPTAFLKMTLHEGRNRQVRKMTAAVGYPTLRLMRISSGPIRLEGLQPGEWRDLTDEERATLLKSVRLKG